MSDVVWHSGSRRYLTFHEVSSILARFTTCGKSSLGGRLLSRTQAADEHMVECRRCFGHAQTRKPIVGDRVNRP